MTQKLRAASGEGDPREIDGAPVELSVEQTNNPVSEKTQAAVIVIIDGAAVAKGRARVTRKGFVFTPAATRKYEAHGRLAAQFAMQDRQPIAGPVKIFAHVELPVPQSWSARRRAAAITGDIRPTSRPDLDNYLKAALDALNGIVMVDDSQVVELEARKLFGVDPKLVLTVTPLLAQASNARAT